MEAGVRVVLSLRGVQLPPAATTLTTGSRGSSLGRHGDGAGDGRIYCDRVGHGKTRKGILFLCQRLQSKTKVLTEARLRPGRQT